MTRLIGGDAQLADLLRRQGVDLVLDVGANRGQYSARLYQNGYDGRAVSFEPQAGCRSALEAAAAERHGWTVAPAMALGDRDGDIELNLSAETDMSSIRVFAPAFLLASPSSAYIGRETVPLTRLDTIFEDYVEAADRVLLKIDTQGYEREILIGADGVLDRIRGVQVEMSLVPLYEGEAMFDELHAFLTSRGFSLHLVIPGYYSRHMGRMLQVDGVYFRDSPA